MMRQAKQLLCVECGAIRPTLCLPLVPTDPIERTYGPMIRRHMVLMTMQMLDSSLESTRVFWRLKFGATDEQAHDTRPFASVMTEDAP